MVVGGGNSEKEVGDRDGAGKIGGGSGAVEIVGGGGEHAVNVREGGEGSRMLLHHCKLQP
uniref:Uncharacterized protein n=1 Tax=Oryza nivara TaxID=4536 RepID=A0A0E0J0W7_ORYNI